MSDANKKWDIENKETTFWDLFQKPRPGKKFIIVLCPDDLDHTKPMDQWDIHKWKRAPFSVRWYWKASFLAWMINGTLGRKVAGVIEVAETVPEVFDPNETR